MIFRELDLSGAYLIEPERFEDARGFFARTWCVNEFERHGLNSRLVQCNISYNRYKGTLRGMHYQAEPYGETKLVRCTAGGIYDVVIDLRPTSPTFRQWRGIELSAQNRLMLYIPAGFAHGFETLTPDTEVFYQMSEFYQPDAARGIRWNDPAFGIVWPSESGHIMSAKDAAYEDFNP